MEKRLLETPHASFVDFRRRRGRDYLATPDAQHGIMDTSPRSFLAKMREVRDEVARGQRPGGIMGTTFIVNEYNMMIGTFGRGPFH
jgi:hypothetical protein